MHVLTCILDDILAACWFLKELNSMVSYFLLKKLHFSAMVIDSNNVSTEIGRYDSDKAIGTHISCLKLALVAANQCFLKKLLCVCNLVILQDCVISQKVFAVWG